MCEVGCKTLLTHSLYRKQLLNKRNSSTHIHSLPADVTSVPSLLVFRRLLKTELCRRSFPDN